VFENINKNIDKNKIKGSGRKNYLFIKSGLESSKIRETKRLEGYLGRKMNSLKRKSEVEDKLVVFKK